MGERQGLRQFLNLCLRAGEIRLTLLPLILQRLQFGLQFLVSAFGQVLFLALAGIVRLTYPG